LPKKKLLIVTKVGASNPTTVSSQSKLGAADLNPTAPTIMPLGIINNSAGHYFLLLRHVPLLTVLPGVDRPGVILRSVVAPNVAAPIKINLAFYTFVDFSVFPPPTFSFKCQFFAKSC
jgi:hypothetical protein